jgi:hypothetical protein
MSRKTSEKSDSESNGSLSTSSLTAVKVLPTFAMNKSTSSLNQLESSPETVDGNIMLPSTPTALPNITKSPFTLFLSGKEGQSALNMDEEDYATESTMDDNEVRRLAFFNDSDTTNMSITQDNSNNPIKRCASSAPILSITSQDSKQLATASPKPVPLPRPLHSSEETIDIINIFSPMEKKFRALPRQLQNVLVKCLGDLSIPRSVEQVLQFYKEQNTVKRKLAASVEKKVVSSPSSMVVSFKTLLAVLTVVHKAKLGTDGNFINAVCCLCLLEITLSFQWAIY